MFATYDRDGSGHLQYGEMKDFMRDLLLESSGSHITPDRIAQYSKDVIALIDKLVQPWNRPNLGMLVPDWLITSHVT